MVTKPASTSLDGEHPVQIRTPAIGATTSDEVLVWRNNTGRTVRISKAGFSPDTALTGAATNNLTLQFKSKVAAGTAKLNVTAIKTYASGTDIAQFAEDELVVSSTIADLLVLNGECVTLDKAENGTGLALPAGIATLEYTFNSATT